MCAIRGTKNKGTILILRSLLPCEGRKASKWTTAGQCDKNDEKADVQETMGQSNIVVFCLIKKLPLIGEINVKW